MYLRLHCDNMFFPFILRVADEVAKEPEELADVVSDTEESPAVDEKKDSKKKDVSKEESESLKSKKKTKFKPYKGRMKSAGVSKMTESLEETEMQMIYNEVAKSLPHPDDKPSTLLNMPASCTSILKVTQYVNHQKTISI